MSVAEKDCVSVLESYLGPKAEFTLQEFRYEPFSEVMGFHGEHALLRLKYQLRGDGKPSTREITFFVKSAAQDQRIFEEYLAHMRCFYKEHITLTKVLKELQKEVSDKITAECYLSKLDKFVVLENLSLAGFKTQIVPQMDLSHAKKALEAFANLHAASFIWEHRTGESILDRFKDINFEMFFMDKGYNEKGECLLRSAVNGARDVILKFFPKSHDYSENETLSVADYIKKLSDEMVNSSKKYHNVVCQGDPWGNNILYKYDDKENPVKAILVDFQGVRLVPPALEVMQFLHLSTSREFRQKNQTEVINHYYDTLSRILEEHGLVTESVLSKSDFLDSCQHYRKFGIVIRVLYTYITRIPPEYLKPVTESPEAFLSLMIGGNSEYSIEAFENHSGFRELFTEAVEEAFELYRQECK